MVIDGARTAADSGHTYDSIDPHTGQPWARVPEAAAEDVDAAVAAARGALSGPWGDLPPTQRRPVAHQPRGCKKRARAPTPDAS